MSMDTEKALQVATELADEAGKVLRQGFGRVHQVTLKGAVNPVTETDVAVESLIVSRLRDVFPDHRIHGEESGAQGRADAQAPIWFIDPLDGTNNFAHGYPHFCVSLGLWLAGTALVGVIYDPLRDEMFTARRGKGTFLNGRPVRVTGTTHLADALLATGFPYDRRVAADNNTRTLDHFLRRSQGVRRAGAAALDLAYVASGRLDGYWEARLSWWDIAAGVLLVREAGGYVSDYGGGSVSAAEIVASNGLIHEEMLRVLRDGAAAPHPDFPPLT